MSGAVILIASLAVILIVLGDDVAHWVRVLCRNDCNHRIPWDSYCVSCVEEKRFRR